MKKLAAATILAGILSTSAQATSTYSCQVVELSGMNYIFHFTASRTPGESLVGARVLMSGQNLGGVANYEVEADRIVQYWNDGHVFNVSIADETLNYVQYQIETTLEPGFSTDIPNHSGRALIKKSGKERPQAAIAQCRVSG